MWSQSPGPAGSSSLKYTTTYVSIILCSEASGWWEWGDIYTWLLEYIRFIDGCWDNQMWLLFLTVLLPLVLFYYLLPDSHLLVYHPHLTGSFCTLSTDAWGWHPWERAKAPPNPTCPSLAASELGPQSSNWPLTSLKRISLLQARPSHSGPHEHGHSLFFHHHYPQAPTFAVSSQTLE